MFKKNSVSVIFQVNIYEPMCKWIHFCLPSTVQTIDSILFCDQKIRIFLINSITNWNLLKEEGNKYQSGLILTQPLGERTAFVVCAAVYLPIPTKAVSVTAKDIICNLNHSSFYQVMKPYLQVGPRSSCWWLTRSLPRPCLRNPMYMIWHKS